ncbi:MAG: hypothetical protein AAB903_01585 [Patescibacteria group bacterium]
MSKMSAWLRNHEKEIFWIIIILLVSTTSFASGYLLASRNNRAPIIIEQPKLGL